MTQKNAKTGQKKAPVRKAVQVKDIPVKKSGDAKGGQLISGMVPCVKGKAAMIKRASGMIPCV